MTQVISTVWRSPLARRMTWIWGCTDGTRAVFATLGPYVIQYTVGAPALPVAVAMTSEARQARSETTRPTALARTHPHAPTRPSRVTPLGASTDHPPDQNPLSCVLRV